MVKKETESLRRWRRLTFDLRSTAEREQSSAGWIKIMNVGARSINGPNQMKALHESDSVVQDKKNKLWRSNWQYHRGKDQRYFKLKLRKQRQTIEVSLFLLPNTQGAFMLLQTANRRGAGTFFFPFVSKIFNNSALKTPVCVWGWID